MQGSGEARPAPVASRILADRRTSIANEGSASETDRGYRILTPDEQLADCGGLLRWVEGDMPMFHDVPPHRRIAGRSLPLVGEDLKAWCKRVSVPSKAVEAGSRGPSGHHPELRTGAARR